MSACTLRRLPLPRTANDELLYTFSIIYISSYVLPRSCNTRVKVSCVSQWHVMSYNHTHVRRYERADLSETRCVDNKSCRGSNRELGPFQRLFSPSITIEPLCQRRVTMDPGVWTRLLLWRGELFFWPFVPLTIDHNGRDRGALFRLLISNHRPYKNTDICTLYTRMYVCMYVLWSIVAFIPLFHNTPLIARIFV